MFKFLPSLFNRSSQPHKGSSNDIWHSSSIIDCLDGVWDWNLETKEHFISPKLRDLIGYTEEETKGQPTSWWLEKIHPDDKLQLMKKIDDISNNNTDFMYFDGCRFLCKSGDYVWLENHVKLLKNNENKTLRIASAVINITPQKYILHQLYNIISDQEKEARNKMKFLSSLSHEFRSPLSGILGMTTLLKESNLTADQRHFTDNISNSTEMLLDLVNDILDVSKLNSGKFEFEKIQFSPEHIIRRATDLIRPSIMKKNLTFTVDVNKTIPESIVGDPTRLQQILVNLLSNAAKFTSSGGITLKAHVSDTNTSTHQDNDSKSHQQSLRFEISDTGIGIAPEVQEHLFEDYTQANRSITRMYGGTGLGLSICKELVQLMGGQIGVNSILGNGSTFWFSVPFVEVRKTPSLDVSNVPLSQAAPTQEKLRILLVEDNQVNQDVMRGLLQLLGDDVTIANNGEEAVELFKTKQFDIILMDLNMPILDGLSATQAIRALPNSLVPIIAVTANTFSKELENCIQHGISHVLNKPIDKNSLETLLRPYRSSSRPQTLNTLREVTPTPPTHIVDQRTIHTLIQDLGKEKVSELIGLYRKDGLNLVSQIKNNLPSHSADLAHTLAGMSENLGALSVGKAAREIMDVDKSNTEAMPVLVNNLERQFENSLIQLEEFLKPHEPYAS